MNIKRVEILRSYRDKKTKRAFGIIIKMDCWTENYGEDADGNRGVMTDFWEPVDWFVKENNKPVDWLDIPKDLQERIEEFIAKQEVGRHED